MVNRCSGTTQGAQQTVRQHLVVFRNQYPHRGLLIVPTF
jgi:hypothetical protein